jgi:serine/threonine protein kinase
MIKSTFLLFFIYAQLPLFSRSATADLIKEQFEQGRKCMDGDLYKQVVSSPNGQQYYVQKLCYDPSKTAQQARAVIKSKYGNSVKLLGKGSFGKVFLYQNGSTQYAIKKPLNFDYEDLFKELNASECLKENLEGSDSLNSMAYILECVSPTASSPHLIMKYYPKTLEAFVNSKNPSGWNHLASSTKTLFLKQMLHMSKTLAALHSKNMVHRDLKPENIMVNSKSVPILVDFGLLSPLGDLAKTRCGTPYFLDYELINRTNHGRSTDVYSMLGTFAYMIHGKNGLSVLNSVLIHGNYKAAMSNYTVKFNPRFSDFKLPSEFNWMNGMFIPKASGRMTMDEVTNKLSEMLGLNNQPMQATKAVIQNPRVDEKQVQEVNQVHMNPKPELQKKVQDMPVQQPVVHNTKNQYLVKPQVANQMPVKEEPKYLAMGKPVDQETDYRAKMNAKIKQIQEAHDREDKQKKILKPLPEKPVVTRFKPTRHQPIFNGAKVPVKKPANKVQQKRGPMMYKQNVPAKPKKVIVQDTPNKTPITQPVQYKIEQDFEHKKYPNPYLKGIGANEFDKRRQAFEQRQNDIQSQIEKIQQELDQNKLAQKYQVHKFLL